MQWCNVRRAGALMGSAKMLVGSFHRDMKGCFHLDNPFEQAWRFPYRHQSSARVASLGQMRAPLSKPSTRGKGEMDGCVEHSASPMISLSGNLLWTKHR